MIKLLSSLRVAAIASALCFAFVMLTAESVGLSPPIKSTGSHLFSAGSDQLLVASIKSQSLNKTALVAVSAHIDELKSAYFRSEIYAESWAYAISYHTLLTDDGIRLSDDMPSGRFSGLCADATPPPVISRPKKPINHHKNEKPPMGASPRKSKNNNKIVVLPTQDEIFNKSIVGYYKRVELSACRIGLIAATLPYQITDPVIVFKSLFSLGHGGSNNSINLQKPIILIEPGSGVSANGFHKSAKDFVLTYKNLILKAAVKVSSGRPADFYNEKSLKELFLSTISSTEVAAASAQIAATDAAKAFRMSEKEASDWIQTITLAPYLGVKVYGRALLDQRWGASEAAACGLDDGSQKELSQSYAGFYLSACQWHGHLEYPTSKVARLTKFYQKWSMLAPPATNFQADFGSQSLDLEKPVDPRLSKVLAAWRLTRMPFAYPKTSDTQTILSLMDMVKTDFNERRSLWTARKIASVGRQIFQDRIERRDWFIVLAIESKFIDGLTSPTGAVGYGQLIPSYYADFGLPCNFKDTQRSDIEDDLSNLILSACYLSGLRENQEDNSASLSLVAYNAGPNSSALKSYGRLTSMSTEPANYVARFSLLAERLQNADVPANPDYNQTRDGQKRPTLDEGVSR